MEQPILKCSKKASLGTLIVFLFILPFIIFSVAKIYQGYITNDMDNILPFLIFFAVSGILFLQAIKDFFKVYIHVYPSYIEVNEKNLQFSDISSISHLQTKHYERERNHSEEDGIVIRTPTFTDYLIFKNQKNEEIFRINTKFFNSPKNLQAFLLFLHQNYPSITFDETVQSMTNGTF